MELKSVTLSKSIDANISGISATIKSLISDIASVIPSRAIESANEEGTFKFLPLSTWPTILLNLSNNVLLIDFISEACNLSLFTACLNTLTLKEVGALYKVSLVLIASSTLPVKLGDINPLAIISAILSASNAALAMLSPFML